MVSNQIKGKNTKVIDIINDNQNVDEYELRKKERDFSIIGNEFRLKIIIQLSKYNKLNFNKLAELTKINKNKLAYHIALLKNNNFINNEKIFNKEERTFSFYSITDKGKQYLNLISKPIK